MIILTLYTVLACVCRENRMAQFEMPVFTPPGPLSVLHTGMGSSVFNRGAFPIVGYEALQCDDRAARVNFPNLAELCIGLSYSRLYLSREDFCSTLHKVFTDLSEGSSDELQAVCADAFSDLVAKTPAAAYNAFLEEKGLSPLGEELVDLYGPRVCQKNLKTLKAFFMSQDAFKVSSLIV
jgi:hypothetical protein